MPCNTSTNIISGVSKLNAYKEASRLVIVISEELSPSIGVGDVIRYDSIDNIYKLSVANGTVESEVVGIVESINTDNSKNVVIYGSINLPSQNLIYLDADPTGASGGNDIFFLSDTVDGGLQNLAPSGSTSIIKAVYQIAPHGSYTGIVINKIGYSIGGPIVNNLLNDQDDIGFLHKYLALANDTDITNYPFYVVKKSPTGLYGSSFIKKSENLNYFNKYGVNFGYIEISKLSPEFPVNSNILNWFLFDYYQPNSSFFNGQVTSIDAIENTITITKGSQPNQIIPTQTINQGNYRYWIESSPTTTQVAISQDNVTNSSAYLQTPITFIENDIDIIGIPILNPVTASTSIFDAAGILIPNTIFTVNFIIKKENSQAALNIPANSLINQLNVVNLNVGDITISDKLLELENRLTYIENRLSM